LGGLPAAAAAEDRPLGERSARMDIIDEGRISRLYAPSRLACVLDPRL
jgi:hypothetical protein